MPRRPVSRFRGLDASEGLRLAVLLILGVLVVRGLEPYDAPGDDVLRLPAPVQVSAQEIRDPARWTELVRHAAEAPLTAMVSGQPPPFLVEHPVRLRADRPAALAVTAYRPMGLRLISPGGVGQTLELEAGEGEAFVLRPRQAGWAFWRLEPFPPELRTLDWSGWVEPARPLRILALSGPPSQESRMALRALEEADEDVESWIHLGRNLWIGREPGPLPTDPQAYQDFDVVVLLPGLSIPPPTADALMEVVRERGRGLLLAATDGGSERLAATAFRAVGVPGWERTVRVRGDTLNWVLPPEVTPLPDADLETGLRTWSGAPAAFGMLGRGRIGVLALTETWRWRMEAGADDEHRHFWWTTTSWLAGGLIQDPAIEPMGADHREGEAVAVRVLGEPDPPRLRLSDPGDRETAFDLSPERPSPVGTVREATFAALSTGGHRLSPEFAPPRDPLGAGWSRDHIESEPSSDHIGSEPSPDQIESALGIWVDRWEAPHADPAGRLARLALASPGGRVSIVPPGQAIPAPDERPDLPWLVLGFTLLTAVLGSEWILRRVRGGA